MIEINLVDFVLYGKIDPFSTQTVRKEIIDLLGKPDQPSYPTHVVYGNLCFDLAQQTGPLGLVQIGFPHENHSRCPHPDWAETWTPPPWVDEWPDCRFVWKLGPFVPDATLPDIQSAIPGLQELVPEESLGGFGGRHTLFVPESMVWITYESAREGSIETLSWIVGPPGSGT